MYVDKLMILGEKCIVHLRQENRNLNRIRKHLKKLMILSSESHITAASNWVNTLMG